jgi:hypothetical protein
MTNADGKLKRSEKDRDALVRYVTQNERAVSRSVKDVVFIGTTSWRVRALIIPEQERAICLDFRDEDLLKEFCTQMKEHAARMKELQQEEDGEEEEE